MTAVEFSVENLHGKAMALLNLKSGSLKETIYDHEKMVKSSGCFGSCGGHGGCSSCSNCGGRCGAEAEECVGNYDHEKMVKSSGCYGPCGGYGGCSSCNNCGGGGCRAEATNEAVAA
ncbi:hypothetical protein Q3G72_012882 [Acer saccharum]|nr:hypothetical protein Q3G72_012882 [Acer saccharum]